MLTFSKNKKIKSAASRSTIKQYLNLIILISDVMHDIVFQYL